MTKRTKLTNRRVAGASGWGRGGASQAAWLVVAAGALVAACSAPTRASSGITTTTARAQASSDADYGYEFESDSMKNAGASPAADLSLPHAEGDRIPPETVQAILRSHYAAIARCYQTGLAKNPALAGTVTVKVVAGANGATQRAADDGSTLPDKDVVACAVAEVTRISYPPGGGVLTIVYPIALAP